MTQHLLTLLALVLLLPATTLAQICEGDCANDGSVTVDEVVTGVNLALGTAPLSQCNPFDRDGSGGVTVDELVAGINNALSGCPTPPAQSLRGVAATGVPIVGQVCAVAADGDEVGCSATAIDGSFRIGTGDTSGPFLLEAMPTSGSTQPQFSWSPNSDGLANATTFSTLALLLATNYADLRDVYDGWAVARNSVDPEVLTRAVDAVLENFANRLNGVVPSNFDPITTPFVADGTGFDGVLDALNFNFDFVNGTVTLNGAPLVIDFDPDTNPGGNFRLTIQVMVFSGPTQTIVLDNVPKPANSVQFCDPQLFEDIFVGVGSYTLNSCTFDGTVGRITATVMISGFAINYTVTYTYTPMR